MPYTHSPLNAYSTGLLQGTAYSRLHAHLTKALFPFGVSIPEWKLLGQVYENHEVNLSALAQLLDYDPPMVTKLVKQLERKKLLKRELHKHDERIKVITITLLGTKLIREAEPTVKQTMNKILEGITREELLTYIKVLSHIVKNTAEM